MVVVAKLNQKVKFTALTGASCVVKVERLALSFGITEIIVTVKVSTLEVKVVDHKSVANAKATVGSGTSVRIGLERNLNLVVITLPQDS